MIDAPRGPVTGPLGLVLQRLGCEIARARPVRSRVSSPLADREARLHEHRSTNDSLGLDQRRFGCREGRADGIAARSARHSRPEPVQVVFGHRGESPTDQEHGPPAAKSMPRSTPSTMPLPSKSASQASQRPHSVKKIPRSPPSVAPSPLRSVGQASVTWNS